MIKTKRLRIKGCFYLFCLLSYASYTQEYYDDEFYAYEEDYENQDYYADEVYGDAFDDNTSDYYDPEFTNGSYIWAIPLLNPYFIRYQSEYVYSNNYFYLFDYTTDSYRRRNRAVGIRLIFNDFNSPYLNSRNYYRSYFPRYIGAGSRLEINFNIGPAISFNFFNRRGRRGWGWQNWYSGRYYQTGIFRRYNRYGRFNRYNRYNRYNRNPYGWGWQIQSEGSREADFPSSVQRGNRIATSNPRVRRSNVDGEGAIRGRGSTKPRPNSTSNRRSELRSKSDRSWQNTKRSNRHNIERNNRRNESISTRTRRSKPNYIGKTSKPLSSGRKSTYAQGRANKPKSTIRDRSKYNHSNIGQKRNSIKTLDKRRANNNMNKRAASNNSQNNRKKIIEGNKMDKQKYTRKSAKPLTNRSSKKNRGNVTHKSPNKELRSRASKKSNSK